MRQAKLFNSVKAAFRLDENAMFNAVLTDKGLQKWILDLNRSQLFDGEDSLGVQLRDIGGGYSITTQFLNQGRTFQVNLDGETKSNTKEVGESPFLYDTGEYYESYTFNLGNGLFTITSDPIKDGDNLEDRYGDDLEGLQDENLQKLIDVIRKKFIKEVRVLLAA